MDVRPAMGPSRPQTVAELVKQAESFTFNTNIPLKHWTRAAETLYQEASFALSDGDYGRAYMMLYRHSVLVLNYLPKHPQYKDPDQKRACRTLSKRVSSVLKDLEQLKPEIDKAYKEWETMKPAANEKPQIPNDKSSRYAQFAARDPSLSGNTKILDASEHQELAVDLAQKELTRRDTVRRASRKAGIPEEETIMRRRAGRWDGWDGSTRGAPEPDLRSQMEAVRRNLDAPAAARSQNESSNFAAHSYNYPSISKSRPVDYDQNDFSPPKPPAPLPSRPPKELPLLSRESNAMPPPGQRPEVPQKVTLNDYKPLMPTTPGQDARVETPALPPKTDIEVPAPPKKERLTFKPGAYLENGDPIRSVFLPRGIRKAFVDAAAENTRKGVEMCGILCGTPINNALFIRCLLIPDQKCTPDTCETENESAVFDYCDSEDLLVLGWIHTHPTQTCFMSSRDLHTHAGYQIMMPESMAIVCAPKFTPSYGIFRLTNPPGLEHILHCNHTDTFHQHSIDNLYREAEQPSGHVYETDKMPFYIHDLRGQ